jgi:predicted nucleic acid-binding protein
VDRHHQGKPRHALQQLEKYDVGEIGISWVTLAELEFGKSKDMPIVALDLMIGAHALRLGATLATNNTREFRRIPGLRVVDWLPNQGPVQRT